MGRIPNNHSRASWELEQKQLHPESAVLKASLRYQQSHPGYVGYIESLEAKIDTNRGYKGRHEESGRTPGSRVIEDPETGEFRLA